jgi:hypothetical protein
MYLSESDDLDPNGKRWCVNATIENYEKNTG